MSISFTFLVITIFVKRFYMEGRVGWHPNFFWLNLTRKGTRFLIEQISYQK